MPYAVAAAAIAAGGSYLSAKEANKGSKQTGDPAYVEDAKISALDKAKAISEREYTPYTGQRVASLSKNERTASNLAKSGNAKGLGYLDQAGSKLGEMQEFDSSTVEKYMNPYMEAVLQPQIREANSQYEKERSRLANSKAGAWGGDRGAFAESELERSYANNVSDLTGRTYANAFESARASFFQDEDRKMKAAQAYQSLGGDVSRMNREQIQDLMATGGTERLLEQADLDFDYKQFIENRDWDVTNLDPLLNAIAASKGSQMKGGGQASPWGEALGAAATVAGMYFTGTGGGGSNAKYGSATSGGEIRPSVVQGTAMTDYFAGGVGA